MKVKMMAQAVIASENRRDKKWLDSRDRYRSRISIIY